MGGYVRDCEGQEGGFWAADNIPLLDVSSGGVTTCGKIILWAVHLWFYHSSYLCYILAQSYALKCHTNQVTSNVHV